MVHFAINSKLCFAFLFETFFSPYIIVISIQMFKLGIKERNKLLEILFRVNLFFLHNIKSRILCAGK